MPRLRPAYPILCAAALLVAGCGTAAPTEGPDREAFIATYVDLRETALRSGAPITEAQRAEVLARHQMTEEDLMRFVEAHGRDVDYMATLWDDVGARLEAGVPQTETP